VVVRAGFTAIVFAVHGVGVVAFLDGAFAVGAVAFSIGHGGRLLFLVVVWGLRGQAVENSVGAAEGCDLLIWFFSGIG
jgi:hypothetical protein